MLLQRFCAVDLLRAPVTRMRDGVGSSRSSSVVFQSRSVRERLLTDRALVLRGSTCRRRHCLMKARRALLPGKMHGHVMMEHWVFTVEPNKSRLSKPTANRLRTDMQILELHEHG